jgi:hypothetical protein
LSQFRVGGQSHRVQRYRSQGELMFFDVNTSPEISYALSALSRYLTQATLQHDIHTKHLLRYVWAAGMPN